MQRLPSSLIGASLIFLVGFLIFVSNFQSVNAEVTYLDDDFESGNFNQWTGTRVSSGETIGVNSYRSLLGAYGGRVTTNGGGGVEYAYCYKKLTASELFVRGAFYIAKSGIVDEGDRFYLMAFQAGGNTLAGVGWRKIGGTVKWFLLIRSGTGNVITYSAESPKLNCYYSVELYWKKDTLSGEGWLWVSSGTPGEYGPTSIICSITGKNTATYGDINEVRVGLPTVSYCGSTAIYFDCVKTASYRIYPVYDYAWFYTIFADGFETGNLGRWSGANAYNGGTAAVVSTLAYSDKYSGRFTSGSASSLSGQAYCYKNVHLPENFSEWSSSLFWFDGFFRVATCNIQGSNGRFYICRALSGSVEVISAGWEKKNGVLRWFLSRKDGTNTVTTYSKSTPVLNKWCHVKITWNPFEYWWGTVGCSMSIDYVDGSLSEVVSYVGQNPTVYRNLDRIDVGLPKTVNCRAVTVYVDDFEIVTEDWE